MTTLDYLKNRLSILAKMFPHVIIKYSFNAGIATHVVELSPEEEYYSNAALDNAWIPISLDFMEQFPNDYISFVSNDSTLRVEDPEFTFNHRQVEVAIDF